jgi:hypothetical protein
MNNQVIIATEPDDTLLDGCRILLVDLTDAQNTIVSASLLNLSLPSRIILYSWSSNNGIDWLIDKKSKCNLIIFNSDSNNDLLVGYLAAQKLSYYFGKLKLLTGVNNLQLYAQEDCEKLLENIIIKHDTF